MNFILAVKIPFKLQRGGMKKVNKDIFYFVDPIARVLANGNNRNGYEKISQQKITNLKVLDVYTTIVAKFIKPNMV